MNEIVLLAAGGAPADAPASALTVAWESCPDAPQALSLPRFMHENLPQIRREARALVYDLGRLQVNGAQAQERLKGGDELSMWWCSLIYESHPKVLPALYPVFKLRALEILIRREKAESLLLYGGEPLLAQTLGDFCRAAGLRFAARPAPGEKIAGAAKGLEGGLKKALVGLYYRLPAPLKALARVKWWFLTHKFLFRRIKTPAPRPPRAASVVTYFPNLDTALAKEGVFRSKYWEKLHDLPEFQSGARPAPSAPAPESAPDRAQRVNWLFIPHPSSEVTLRQCRDWRDAFMRRGGNGASMSFVDEFISWPDVYRAFCRYARIAAQSFKVEKTLREKCFISGSLMNLYPWLSGAFADSFRGWRCLERCLMRIGLRNYVAWAGPQEWFIFPMENCPWERMLAQAARNAGAGPVYGVQHSVVRPTDLRYFDDARTFSAEDCLAFQPDRIFCNGRGARDELLSFGLAPERAGLLEALRYMYLGGPRPAQAQAGPPRLVAVTGFFPDETERHLSMLAESMHIFKNMEVLIKPHPHLPVEGLVAGLFPPGQAPGLSREPVNTLLRPGVILWASNSTTVALEAAISGLPVMVQAPCGDFDLSPAQGLPNVAAVYSPKDVEEFMKNPKPAAVGPDYFALDPDMPRWRELLR